jgi:hypothetical protein
MPYIEIIAESEENSLILYMYNVHKSPQPQNRPTGSLPNYTEIPISNFAGRKLILTLKKRKP